MIILILLLSFSYNVFVNFYKNIQYSNILNRNIPGDINNNNGS